MGVFREGVLWEEELSSGQQPSDFGPQKLSQLKGPLALPLFYREDIKAQADHTPCPGPSLLPAPLPTTMVLSCSHSSHHPQEHAPHPPWQRSLPKCRQSGSQSPPGQHVGCDGTRALSKVHSR